MLCHEWQRPFEVRALQVYERSASFRHRLSFVAQNPSRTVRLVRGLECQTLLLIFFLDTCRCHKRLTTNYRLFPPYVNQFPLTHTGNISVENMTGMLPQILNDLIVTCCQTCASHGESFVDFMYNGTNGEAKQESERNMKLLIEDRNDLR